MSVDIRWRHNPDREDHELYINDEFVASWKSGQVPPVDYRGLNNMLEHAFEAGRAARTKEIRNFIKGVMQ